MPRVTRIPLRAYWFVPRKPWLAVDGTDLVVRVPGWWGGRTWRAPLAGGAVADLDMVVDPGEVEPGYYEEPVVTPYLATTSMVSTPNVAVVFRDPVPVPHLRLLAWDQRRAEIPKRPARGDRPAGRYVDGVMVRAAEPHAAVEALVAAGAERTTDPDGWLRDRRAAVTDPALVAELDRAGRSVTRGAVVCWVLMALGVLTLVAGEPLLADAAEPVGAAVFGAGGLGFQVVQWWYQRRSRGMPSGGGEEEEPQWRP